LDGYINGVCLEARLDCKYQETPYATEPVLAFPRRDLDLYLYYCVSLREFKDMKPVVSEHDDHHLSYGKYVAGFIGSILLTSCAYLLATHVGSTVNRNVLAIVLAVLAIGQFILQMFLFLHIGDERGPRLRLMAAGLMLGVVLILVGGSIWIMNNLNYRMTPQQINQYMQDQDSL
jgi:cytochrome o ubiquinol oxidase operon protein cyoD